MSRYECHYRNSFVIVEYQFQKQTHLLKYQFQIVSLYPSLQVYVLRVALGWLEGQEVRRVE